MTICAWRKKVRGDAGSWKGIEVYLSERGVPDCTHGMCPECLSRHSPEGGGAAGESSTGRRPAAPGSDHLPVRGQAP